MQRKKLENYHNIHLKVFIKTKQTDVPKFLLYHKGINKKLNHVMNRSTKKLFNAVK